MSTPAMIYGTTEGWPVREEETPEWVKRCRGCRSYVGDWHGSEHSGYGLLPNGEKQHGRVCQVEVGCSIHERCNPHNREGGVPRFYVPCETFEQGELRRAREVRAAA